MAYNTYYPTNYPIYPQYPQNYPQQTQVPPQAQTVQQPPQIQNGGFVSVRSIQEAFNYPIAPGNSVTFKDETAPYVYTKTMGFSQLDRPIFKRFRLVEEDAADGGQNLPISGDVTHPINNDVPYALRSDVDALRAAYDEIKNELDALRSNIDKNAAVKTPKAKLNKEDNDNG